MGHMKWVRPFFVLVCVASGCSVPSFGYQSVSQQTLDACRDGKLSPGEADVDCGQVCNAPCATGLACTDDLDCSSDLSARLASARTKRAATI